MRGPILLHCYLLHNKYLTFQVWIRREKVELLQNKYACFSTIFIVLKQDYNNGRYIVLLYTLQNLFPSLWLVNMPWYIMDRWMETSDLWTLLANIVCDSCVQCWSKETHVIPYRLWSGNIYRGSQTQQPRSMFVRRIQRPLVFFIYYGIFTNHRDSKEISSVV